jgi:exodeoxyribonuclease-5
MVTIKIEDNQLRLPNGNIITFNDEQYEGINKIRKWLEQANGLNNTFTLAGYSGTGKTTCIKKILDEFEGQIVVSAPTHKAKKMIIRTTGQYGLTLHGLLGLRPDVNLDDFNPNDPKFNPIALPKICDYSLVIIDEASMINKDLYELIKKQTKGMYTKILFMGDPAQIPPVNEKDSVVFNLEKENFHQLTKVERQADSNPIMFIYDKLRNNLENPTGGYERTTNLNDEGEGIIYTKSKREFRNALLEEFKTKEFNINTDHCKVIGWTNQIIMKSNQIIRHELFGKNADIVEIGDVLMGYRSITGKSAHINIIENSADYKVIEKSELIENKYGINGYKVKLRENLTDSTFNYQTVFIIDPYDDENLNKYAYEHDKLRDQAKANKRLWNLYYTFRRENILMKSIYKYENGASRSSYDIIVKDMDYAYAITAHKGQGSTYNKVFIMEDDIDKNWNVKERNQIKYVALTRPIKNAIVLSKN